ncbi:MAG TPA: hypothetical protein VMT55_04640 [Candidatus Sulfotelmatobacter sp.]|nr:hypothetical protein [Candidatus Sulfotelmatobacter sp.]
MAYVMGTVTPGTPTNNSVKLDWTAASGGTGPYSYKVYRDTVDSFTPGPGNLIATLGTGVLTYTDTGLFPNTQYYYKVQSVDTGNADTTADSAQVSVLTQPYQQQMNQFSPEPYIGMLDQSYNYNTKAVIIDPTVATLLYAGQAVKRSQPTTQQTTPFVKPCTLATDDIWGFLTYSYKDPSFTGSMTATVAQTGDVLYLFCTVDGDLTTQRYGELDLATVGGVKPGVTNDGNTIAVEFLDPPVAGTLIRCQVVAPNAPAAKFF